MENLLIPARIRDALIQYLSNRPWREVEEIMPVLMNLSEAPKAQEQEEK